MDFWDLTKLLVRRWAIALPLLVLSAGLAALAMTQVKPDYVAIAYVQLVPPVSGESQAGQPTVDQRNPWIGLGLQTIGNAAIVTVMDQSVIDELKADGYSTSFTLTMNPASPMITFEVVGASQEQAKQTTENLVQRFTQSVVNLQRAYGVSEADSVTARRLDQGTNVTKSNSKVKRALVAVAGAGMLITAAVTIAVDAWLRRRARRRSQAAAKAAVPVLAERPVEQWPAEEQPAEEQPAAPAAAKRPAAKRPAVKRPAAKRSARARAGSGADDRSAVDSDITQAIDRRSLPSTAPGTAAPEGTAPGETAPGADQPDSEPETGRPTSSDATVVLPSLKP